MTLPDEMGIKMSKMMRIRLWFVVTALVPLLGSSGQAVNPPVRLPGTQADGSVLLHNQWSIRPAGRQVELSGTLPVNIAVHLKGKFAAVLDCGYGPHEVVVVDLIGGKIASRAAVSNSFYGVAFSANGRELYCSGGGDEVVHRFDFLEGQITNDTKIKVHDRTLRAVPCGLACCARARGKGHAGSVSTTMRRARRNIAEILSHTIIGWVGC